MQNVSVSHFANACDDNFKTCIIALLQSDGVSGMFTGIVPRTLRRTLMAAVAWTVYEEVNDI